MNTCQKTQPDLLWLALLIENGGPTKNEYDQLDQLFARNTGDESAIADLRAIIQPALHDFLRWNLIHRSASDLIRLATEAGIPKSQIEIGKEPESVNLFLHARN